MPSTHKHVYLYQAFGWKPPVFAHVGLLQDQTGQKLSKRNMDVDILSYRKMGILPGALVNYVALLGWSHNEVSDVMTMEKLIQTVRFPFFQFKFWLLRQNSSTSNSPRATRLWLLKSSGIYKRRTPRFYLIKAMKRVLMISSTRCMNTQRRI